MRGPRGGVYRIVNGKKVYGKAAGRVVPNNGEIHQHPEMAAHLKAHKNSTGRERDTHLVAIHKLIEDLHGRKRSWDLTDSAAKHEMLARKGDTDSHNMLASAYRTMVYMRGRKK